jgi:hypothetical protein
MMLAKSEFPSLCSVAFRTDPLDFRGDFSRKEWLAWVVCGMATFSDMIGDS